ncbi:MAG: hypothetical protein ABW161_02615 [Candidatus Thiodiazotropha sp.]
MTITTRVDWADVRPFDDPDALIPIEQFLIGWIFTGGVWADVIYDTLDADDAAAMRGVSHLFDDHDTRILNGQWRVTEVHSFNEINDVHYAVHYAVYVTLEPQNDIAHEIDAVRTARREHRELTAETEGLQEPARRGRL